eukprot:CAMPEP_0168749096 /NCGR_PEP_ID=MMETSP0724-20121128/16529_1 /TAXON_ID=265536 /ORGANISM="Amphiprora sp., Strain CCMP467" /LENGTH=547 /DNA_ID=CAMNT_0008796973 /DNA_START=211 /DNA_END=1854 /DNA_ORIENTATION=-
MSNGEEGPTVALPPPAGPQQAPSQQPQAPPPFHGEEVGGPGPSSAVGQGSPPTNGNNSNGARGGRAMIGKKVRVFWPVDESWYTGIVHEYDPSTDEHLLRYEDGDAEWVRIGNTGGVIDDNDAPPLPNAISPGESTASKQKTIQPQQSSHPPSHPPHHPPEQAPYPPPPGGVPGPEDPMARQAAAPPPHGVPPGYYAPAGHLNQPPPPHYHHGSPPPMYMYHPGAPYGAPPRDQRLPGTPGGDRGGIMGMPPHSNHHHHQHEPSPSPTNTGRSGKKGPKAWSKNEDATLLKIVQSMSMPMRWSVVAQSLPDRTGKQCRERYVNHLNPRLKTSDWNPVEDATVFHLYNTIGSHWSTMSKVIPGRTDNGIKNRFHNLRRQLEREDGHRLRLSSENDFPDQIRLDRTRKFPKHLQGKADELWDIESGIGVLSAQSVLGPPGGGSNAAAKNFFGPFRLPRSSSASGVESCVRCGFMVPSVQTGREICEKTGWCIACTRIPPHLSGNLLRECLNLRRCTDDDAGREIMEKWNDPPQHVPVDNAQAVKEEPGQ